MKEQCSAFTSTFFSQFFLAVTLLTSCEMLQAGNSAGKQSVVMRISLLSSVILSLPSTAVAIHACHPNIRPTQSEIPTLSLRYNQIMSNCVIFVCMSVKCVVHSVVYRRKVFFLFRWIALQPRCKGALRCVFGHVDRHSMPNVRTAAT